MNSNYATILHPALKRSLFIGINILLILFITNFSGFCQGSEQAMINATTVDYDDCTGIATIEMPVNDGYCVCDFQNRLYNVDIYSVDPNGALRLELKLTPTFLSTGCSSSSPTISGSCWSYRYCNTTNAVNVPTIVGAGGCSRKLVFSVHDLPGTFFGGKTKFRFIGRYDYDQYGAHYDFDYTKETTTNQATIGQPQISTVTNMDCRTTQVNWTNLSPPGNCGNVFYNIYRDGNYRAQPNGTPFADIGVPYMNPGQTYDYTIQALWPINAYRTDYSNPSSIKSVTIPQDNGSITVNLKTGSGTPINGKTILATRISYDQTSVCSNFSPVASINFGATAGNGTITKNNIYYGHENDDPTVYRISVAGEPHIPTQDVSLDYTPNNAQTITLIDPTAYSVTGRLLSSNGCGVAGAQITADGHAPSNVTFITPDVTDQNGDFTLVLPGPDNYGFYSSFETPTGMMVMDSNNLNITNPSGTYVPIQYSKKDTVRGFVGGDCMEIYGPATVKAYSQQGGCLIATTTSNASTGLYEFILNSHEVEIEVENYHPISGPLVGTGPLNQSIDVGLDSTTIVDFIFQAPITIEIEGFPAQQCSDIDYPILEQGKQYPLLMTVTEGNGCLIDTGYVVMANEISGYDGQSVINDTAWISNGFAVYYLYPATPNIFSPYTKPITFRAYSYSGNSSPAQTISAVVTGASPRGNQFATVSPQIPRLILRDPPGADSYSFMNIGEKFSTTTRTFFQHTEGGNVWAKMKTGIDQRIFGVRLEAGLEVGASISGSKTHVNSEEILFEFESTQKFKTSDNNYITGADGDVYIGAAMNLTYANSDIITFDLARCEINKRVELVIHPDSFATEFALTESYILNFTIPDLQDIVDDPNQSASDRHLAEQSINVWHQVINLNARLKEEAFNGPTVENYTYSNAEIERTFTTTVSETATIEWTSLIEESAGLEAGFSLNGTGPSGGFEVNFKQEFGESETNSTSTTTTAGFFFADDTPGDSYTVDWAFDPVYGTPVFRAANNAGQTSCPWELGAKRDKPFFSIPNPIQTSGSNSVSFDIWLGNQSETEETRSYVLRMASNPNNATVQINGTNGPIWLFPNMAYQQPPQLGYEVVNVIVTKPNNEHYQFEGIQFEFYPACDQYQAATNAFSVFFDSPCSDISMVSPTVANGFVINGDSENKRTIEFGGYTYNEIQSGDEISLEYAPVGTNGWSTSNIVLSKNNVKNNNPAKTPAVWLTGGIEDGLYDIRMKLTCTAGPSQTSTYSPRVSGVIDRTPPEILGATEPEDDDYEMGDEISVLFNETIVASNASLSLTMMPDDITVTTSLILDGNKISVFPSSDISTEIGKIFEVVITNLEDEYNNVADPISWTFTVGDIDSDGDGYTDSYEQCIGSALHFDKSGYITVPHDPAFNVVEGGLDFTFEAWVFPDEHSTWKAIASKGHGSNAATEYIFALSDPAFNNVMGLYLSGEWEFGNTPVPLGKWSHLAVSVDGATKVATFYLNGVPDGSKTYSTTTFHSGDVTPFNIGRQGNGCACNLFDGRIDDVIVWQHELTQAEIMATMAGNLAGNETDLVAYFDFDDYESCVSNTGNNIVADKSTNANNGTLTNFSLEGCSSNWATERFMDSDRDGIPDGCDEIDDCFDLNDTGDTDGDLLLACADLCPATKDVALDFDGVDDFIYHAPNPAFTFMQGDFAFEAWVNPTNNEYDPIFLGYDPSLIGIVAFDLRFKRIALFLRDATDTLDQGEYLFSISEVPLNQWSHIAVSFDASTKQATFYLNGEHDGTRQSKLSTIVHSSNMHLYYGFRCIPGEPCGRFEGRMDDLAIWERTLSEYNIKQTMAAPLSGLENGLISFLDLNEGQACSDNSALPLEVNDKGPNNLNFNRYNFSYSPGCVSNYVMGRNTDSDGDMIGDACDTSAFGCPPNYAGTNQLVGDQEYSTFFDTDGAIESIQQINDPAGVIYNSDTSVELLPEFEVKLGSSLEVKLDGCPD